MAPLNIMAHKVKADNDNGPARIHHPEGRLRLLVKGQAAYYFKLRMGADKQQALLFAFMRHLPEWQELYEAVKVPAGLSRNLLKTQLKAVCRQDVMRPPVLPNDDFPRYEPVGFGFDYEDETVNTVIREAITAIVERDYKYLGPFTTDNQLAEQVAEALPYMTQPMVKNMLRHYVTDDEGRYFWAMCYPASGMDDGLRYWDRIAFPLLMEQLHGPWEGKDFSVLCHHVEEMVGPPHRSMEGLMRACVSDGQLEALRDFFPALLKTGKRGGLRYRAPPENEEDGA